MKKILLCFAIIIIGTFSLTSCKKQKLYLLNWNEYLNGSLVQKFQKKFNCKIEAIPSESNEDMYTVINNGQYPIDVAIPSDYMIEKLYNENKLNKLDFSKMPNYKADMFDDNLTILRNSYFEDNESYAIPYFWGTIGIMYNARTSGLEDIILQNGWDVFFNEDLINKNEVKIGMYNNPRDAIAVAELYLDYSLNTIKEDELEKVRELLVKQNQTFDVKYASDDLKAWVAQGVNLDFAMVYSGDFFDQLYILEEEGLDNYINIYIPEKTNIYFDGMVIPKTSKNTDLAYEFLNFMLDTDNIVENVEYVGYCPCTKAAIAALKEDEYYSQIIETYDAFYPGNAINGGELYHDLGDSIYVKLADIYRSGTIAK